MATNICFLYGNLAGLKGKAFVLTSHKDAIACGTPRLYNSRLINHFHSQIFAHISSISTSSRFMASSIDASLIVFGNKDSLSTTTATEWLFFFHLFTCLIIVHRQYSIHSNNLPCLNEVGREQWAGDCFKVELMLLQLI